VLRRFCAVEIRPDGSWRLVSALGTTVATLPPGAARLATASGTVRSYFTAGGTRAFEAGHLVVESPDGRWRSWTEPAEDIARAAARIRAASPPPARPA
jgi:hypothetical protein